MNPQRMGNQTSTAHPGETYLPTTPPELAAQHPLFAAPVAAPSDASFLAACRLEMRRTETLKPHSSLLKQNLQPTAERLLMLEKLGNAIFEQPLLITNGNLIVDGYARWIVAKRKQRSTMLCQVCQLTEQEALQRILQKHRSPEWWNAFIRILLALDLERGLREEARANQSAGGKEKVSSKLTEDRRLDCRKQIAEAAGVSTGNVAKVKQILKSRVAREVIEGLRTGEISIHGAWQLSKLSIRGQEAELGYRRNKKHSTARIRKLLSRQIPKNDPVVASVRHLSIGLTGLKNTPWMSFHWKQIDDLIMVIEHKFSTSRSIPDADQAKHEANPGRQSDSLEQCADTVCGPRELPENDRLPNACTRG